MRQELLDKRKKMLLTIMGSFAVAIIVLVLWLVFFDGKFYNRNFKKDYFSVVYDDSWESSKTTNHSITLTHSTNSIVDINVSKLTSKNRRSSIDLIKEEVRYDIIKNNNTYKLINAESVLISKNKYKGYKMLFEGKDAQNMTFVFKNDKYLCVVNYTAQSKYFDMNLNSVHYIIENIKLN